LNGGEREALEQAAVRIRKYHERQLRSHGNSRKPMARRSANV
jgi:hypothetical protein